MTDAILTKEQVNMHVGARIKAHRTRLGWTQLYAAWRIGMSRANLANIEAGRLPCLPIHLYNLCRVLGCTPNDLFP